MDVGNYNEILETIEALKGAISNLQEDVESFSDGTQKSHKVLLDIKTQARNIHGASKELVSMFQSDQSLPNYHISVDESTEDLENSAEGYKMFTVLEF